MLWSCLNLNSNKTFMIEMLVLRLFAGLSVQDLWSGICLPCVERFCLSFLEYLSARNICWMQLKTHICSENIIELCWLMSSIFKMIMIEPFASWELKFGLSLIFNLGDLDYHLYTMIWNSKCLSCSQLRFEGLINKWVIYY